MNKSSDKTRISLVQYYNWFGLVILFITYLVYHILIPDAFEQADFAIYYIGFIVLIASSFHFFISSYLIYKRYDFKITALMGTIMNIVGGVIILYLPYEEVTDIGKVKNTLIIFGIIIIIISIYVFLKTKLWEVKSEWKK